MKENNLLKFLIPLVAVVVIAESVVIGLGLNKKESASQPEMTVEEKIVNNAVSPVVTVKKEAAVAELLFSVDSTAMQVGKTYRVAVGLSPKKDLAVDAIDLYVKYDPVGLNVTNLIAGKTAPKPQFIKVSKDKGMLVTNYLVSEAKGWLLTGGKVVDLVTFEVTPEKEGDYRLEISSGTGSSVSATMIVESGTAKVLPFSSSVLDVRVSQ